MKADQFSPKQAGPLRPLEERARHKTKSHKAAPPAEAVYGVSDPNGHVIKRVRETNPRLWHKIQNLD